MATKPQKMHLKWVSGSLESGERGLTHDWCLKTHTLGTDLLMKRTHLGQYRGDAALRLDTLNLKISR